MSILIKGAKMPKECECCMFAGFGGAANEYHVCMFNGKWKDRYSHGRMESCPLVEIPPHGRLIDADRLSIQRENYDTYNDYSEAFDMIDNAPTVIESEEQEHE